MIVFDGNIGSTKSWSSAALHGKLLGSRLYPESVNTLYLNPMYDELKAGIKPSKAAYAMQWYQLTNRILQHWDATEYEWRTGKQTILDRCVISDGAFAHNLYKSGFLSDLDYNTYVRHRALMEKLILPPQVVVRFYAPVEVYMTNIKKRMVENGERESECAITEGYLKSLDDSYDEVVWPWYRDHGCRMINIDISQGYAKIEDVMEQISKYARL